MPVKFTFLGFEFSNKDHKCYTKDKFKKEKMVKRKLSPQQNKFGKAVQSCHKSTNSKEAFGSCMSKKLTSSKKQKRRSKKN